MHPTEPPFARPPEPPGAKGARICGILAIVLSLTCIGIPVAIGLGITALVLQAKAKRLHREAPEAYAPPTQTGLVTGIVGLVLPVIMLPFLGIVSAIAIPALLGQRARARDKAAISNMIGRLGELVATYERTRELGISQPETRAQMESQIQGWLQQDKNPWNLQIPAYTAEVQVVEGGFAQGSFAEVAEAYAVEKGQVTFVVQFPRPGSAGYLAGAVRTGSQGSGQEVTTRVIELE